MLKKSPPLNLNDAVHVTKMAENGLPWHERGFVVSLHDDFAWIISIDSGGYVLAKRENIVTENRMRELRSK